EHEVVAEQLAAAVEQLRQPAGAVVGVETVVLLHRHPGQFAPLPGELVADPCVLLLSDEELLTCNEPLGTRADLVRSHGRVLLLSHAAWGSPSRRAAFCRSSAFAKLVRQLSAIAWDIGSGKISSSPRAS